MGQVFLFFYFLLHPADGRLKEEVYNMFVTSPGMASLIR
jgi:hypothetical protein